MALPATDSSPNNIRASSLGSLFVATAAFGFSSKAVLVKLAYGYPGDVDAITLMALRMVISLPFFIAAALWLQRSNRAALLNRRDWVSVIGLGFLGYYLASFLDFSGLQYISAGLERLILFLYPTLVIVLSAFLQRRPVHRYQRAALLISYTGIAMVFWNDSDFGSTQTILGSALVLASATAFALFMIGSGVVIHKVGATRFTSYSMTAASLCTGFHFGLTHESISLDLPPQIYGLAALMAIISTVLPAFLMSAGIRRIGPGNAS
ncbi:MAG: DMT family transporter, partial [Gammaproteobacteria bacterium]|nr:DMT family transporter [Gammaproteobacteria bacterium]